MMSTRQFRALLIVFVLFPAAMQLAGCRPECVTCVEVAPPPTPPPATPPPVTQPPVTQPPAPPAPPVTQPPQPPPPPPPAAQCRYALERNPQPFLYTGGNGGLSVTTDPQTCAWTAVSNASWITITNNASGVGNGRFNYDVAPNPGPPRTGTITLLPSGLIATITQEGAPAPPSPSPSACRYAVEGNPQTFLYTGGNGGLSVTTDPQNCPWTASSSVFWIEVLNGSSRVGSGQFNYNVAGNGGPARTGTITVTGTGFSRTVTVTQQAAPGQ